MVIKPIEEIKSGQKNKIELNLENPKTFDNKLIETK